MPTGQNSPARVEFNSDEQCEPTQVQCQLLAIDFKNPNQSILPYIGS